MPGRAPSGGLLAGAIGAADRWLTPRRIRLYCMALLLSSVLAAGAAAFLGDPPFDAFDRPIGADFVAQTTAGRIAAAGRIAELYDPALQRSVQQAMLGPGHERYLNLFLMPPFAAYLYAPFAALPYLAAVALWTVLSIGLVLASLAWLWPLVPGLHRISFGTVVLVAFSTQPVIELLGDAQDAALSLALLAGALRLLIAGRDAAAGALLGLGVFKPQIFILFPWLLLVERRWRGFLAWAVTALGLAAVSFLMVGGPGVRAYLGLLESDLYRLGIAEGLRWKMQSLPALASALLPPGRALLGSPSLLRDLVPVGAAAATLLAVLRGGRAASDASPASIVRPYALAVLFSACANPHFLLYDCTVLLLPALVLLNAAPADPELRTCLLALYVLLWTAPMRYALFGGLPWPLSLPAAPWAAAALVALTWLASRRNSGTSAAART